METPTPTAPDPQRGAAPDGATREIPVRAPRGARRLREENEQLRGALEKTGRIQDELREMVELLSAEPWPLARLIRSIETPRGPRALVLVDGGRRLVSLHPECDAGALHSGDFVQLDSDRNVLMTVLDHDMPSGGELAHFERFTGDGRIVVRARDEELVVDAGARLDLTVLAAGDPVRWDRSAELALERFEPKEGDSFLLEDVGDVGREMIGGPSPIFERLFEGLALPLLEPDAARALAIGEPPAALLHGPPGTGKTLHARALAAEVQRHTGRPCRLAVVRPGEFKSPYVGETEARIRACFAALARAAKDELVVLFLDEIDAIGRIRGGTASQHADSALGALLAEIGGFEKRGNVAIIAATNRRDMLDSALVSRFQDLDIAVGRPRRDAAASIFGVHLPPSLPYADATGSTDAATVREAAISIAVSRLYAPGGGSAVCRLAMRDASAREVHARELVSGRTIEQIVRMAKRRALARHHRGDPLGIAPGDVEAAVGKVMGDLSTLLTPTNARSHLMDLPHDADVVRVEPLRPRAVRSARIANAC